MSKKCKLKKKRSAAILLGLVLAGTSAATVFAAGWAEENGSWTYLDKDNRPVTDIWKRYEGRYYYLDRNG